MQSFRSPSSASSRSSSSSQQQQQQQQQQQTTSRRRNAADSLFARFQIVLLVATLTLWYMISIAETSIRATSSSNHHPFFDSQDVVDCSKQDSSKKSSQSRQGRKQLLKQIQSTSELTQPYELLTIAIDSRHSCPDLCTFVHPLLPSWVRYRQLHFDTEIDLANKLHNDYGHVIVVARTNIVNIANWAVQRRSTNYTNTTNIVEEEGLATDVRRRRIPTTGLFHNADERFHKGEIVNVYDKFDYVLRQYYRKDESDGKFHGYTLNALGNYTCGTTDQSLPLVTTSSTTMEGTNNDNQGPKWGIHYVPLNAHTVDIQLLHHVTANYPTSLRPTNCSFIGRPDVKRSKHERSTMQSAVQEYGSEMNCTITFTGSFASGNTKFEYFNYDISRAKIGLSPRGSAVETHRLAELLRMGTVPAIVSEDYLYATFKPVPGIIASDWPGVVKLMKEYLVEEQEVLAENQRSGTDYKISKLERLSREGTKWFRDLESCMMADMDYILKGAFGLLQHKK